MHSLDTIPPAIYYLCFLYNSTLGLLSSWEQKEEYLSVWDSSAVEIFFFFLNKLPMYQMTLVVWTTTLSWSCIWCFTLLLPGLGDAEMLRALRQGFLIHRFLRRCCPVNTVREEGCQRDRSQAKCGFSWSPASVWSHRDSGAWWHHEEAGQASFVGL